MTLSNASAAPPASTSMPPPGRGRTASTSTCSLQVAAGRADALDEAREHRAVAAGDVAERLLLRRGVARGEQALHVGPDEDGRHPPVVLAELGEQERLPELLEGGASGVPHQEVLDRHALEPPPVADARAVEDRRREAELAPQAEQRELQEVEPAGERVRRAIDVEAGPRRAPAQLLAEADAPDEVHERRCRTAGSRGRSGPR